MFNAGKIWVQVKLGDAIEKALAAVGITSERIERFLGLPCQCRDRIEKFNRVSTWADRILSGKTEDAEKHLDSIVQEVQAADKK